MGTSLRGRCKKSRGRRGGGRVRKARKGTFLPNPSTFSFLAILYLVTNYARLFSILLDNGRSTARISREDDGV